MYVSSIYFVSSVVTIIKKAEVSPFDLCMYFEDGYRYCFLAQVLLVIYIFTTKTI